MANAIKKFPVPLIFKKILKDRMSGELIVVDEHFTRHLYFENGLLAFASTSQPNKRLGEILVSAGKISRTQLEQTLEIQKSIAYKRKIGHLLIKSANLDKRYYYAALKYQVQAIAVATFPLTTGEWRFLNQKPAIPNPQSFKLKLPDIIHNGVKQLDDISFFKKKFYYRSPVTAAISESIFQSLPPGVSNLYSGLTARPNTQVAHIMSMRNINNREKDLVFWRDLIYLYLLNIVDFVEYVIDEEQNKNIEEINELFKKIKVKDLNYYDLLGIKADAPVEDIKKTYFDYSRKYHPDRLNAAPDSTVMVMANQVFAEINKAFEVLSDNVKKQEYDARGRQEPSAQTLSHGDKVRNARNLYLKANRFYKAKNYSEAANLLEKAVIQDPTRAKFFLLLGLAQAKLPPFIAHAEKNLQKAMEMEPWNADPVFALGDLYRSEGLPKKAEKCFKKALEINMEHTLAGQAIKDIDKLFAPSKKAAFSLFGKKK